MERLADAPAEDVLPPLRDEVLAGRFFGPRAAEATHRLAGLIAGASVFQTLNEWFGMARTAALAVSPEHLRGALDRDIAAIDDLIGAQLDAVLHHPRFAAMEGRWRGLDWLLHSYDSGARIKVRLLTVTWSELARDLDRAAEFDQSQVFQRVYEDEFGMPGGEPFGLLLIDHEVHHLAGPGGDNVSTIKLLAAVAAAAFVPIVLPASPRLLEVDGFSDLAYSQQPASPLRAPSHARWRSLRRHEDMRFICVALPRLLARTTWRDDPARHDGFRYVEYAPDSESHCWMSAGFAFASCVARAFAAFSWPADVRGVEVDREAGGVVLGLPVETDATGHWARSALELVLTDGQERDLIDAGLMPVCGLPFSEEATFSAVRSLQEPARLNTELATANAHVSAQINSMLCVGRFAHYIKVMGRDMVGSMMTADVIERRLQKWLDNYVNGNAIATRDSRAKAPLTAGRVTVTERLGKPGVFGCVVHLQPHFQLDDVSTTFRLVTDLAAPGGR
ncbi:MAG: type VI secretion system contractile sheath large subunit [Acetobacteraceae bacterium]|nr:type VI secretion system contractile sheath large subunit [Acetobacteraceae bacterium]